MCSLSLYKGGMNSVAGRPLFRFLGGIGDWVYGCVFIDGWGECIEWGDCKTCGTIVFEYDAVRIPGHSDRFAVSIRASLIVRVQDHVIYSKSWYGPNLEEVRRGERLAMEEATLSSLIFHLILRQKLQGAHNELHPLYSDGDKRKRRNEMNSSNSAADDERVMRQLEPSTGWLVLKERRLDGCLCSTWASYRMVADEGMYLFYEPTSPYLQVRRNG